MFANEWCEIKSVPVKRNHHLLQMFAIVSGITAGIRGVASPGHSWDGRNLLLRPDSSDGIPEVLGSEGI